MATAAATWQRVWSAATLALAIGATATVGRWLIAPGQASEAEVAIRGRVGDTLPATLGPAIGRPT